MRAPRLPLLLLFLSGLLTATARADVVPFTAVYDLSIGMLKLGEMRRELRLEGDGHYVFESRMQTSGLAALLHPDRVNETSRGRVIDGRYTPDHYAYDNSRKKRRYELVFDRVAGRVRRGDGASDWSAPLGDALFDKLIYQAQLMQDMHGIGDSVSYGIADKDKLKTYLIRVQGREDIDTPHGRYTTVRLDRSTDDARRRTTVWCAQALGWLPVRVDYQDKDGTVTTARLRELITR